MNGRDPSAQAAQPTARALEHASWWRLWFRAVPALGVIIGLASWGLHEPENAERISHVAWCILLVAVAIATRAVVRSVRSLRSPAPDTVAATVGLFFPRVVLSARLATALDADALRAARAHEDAHARHFDPLRIWCAQFATDLLPGRAAKGRFLAWRHLLELARDEEALEGGVDGPDLAAAIVTAARLQHGLSIGAALLGDAARLENRIAILLGRTDTDGNGAPARWFAGPTLVGVALAMWIAFGAAAGEGIVEPFLLR